MTISWLADKIEQWPTAKLVPYARNSRTHSDAQVAQIAASIAEFGFTNPILAGSDRVIVAGHGRLAAAQKLGLAMVSADEILLAPCRRGGEHASPEG
jgi:ParB-like chromosome segregation protein Spo0J